MKSHESMFDGEMMTQLLHSTIDDIEEQLLQATPARWVADALFSHYLQCVCNYAVYIAERCELDEPDVLPMLKDIAERMKQRKGV